MPRTPITVIGNVVNSPSRVRLPSGDGVTNFRMASTERRFDQENQAYVDASTFFVDVECWGDLGAHVSQTVSKGDPVVVFGALRTDEWESDQGRRSKSKIRADAVGLNLAWGVAQFTRSRRGAVAAGADHPAEHPTEAVVPGEGAFEAGGAGSTADDRLDWVLASGEGASESESASLEPALH